MESSVSRDAVVLGSRCRASLCEGWLRPGPRRSGLRGRGSRRGASRCGASLRSGLRGRGSRRSGSRSRSRAHPPRTVGGAPRRSSAARDLSCRRSPRSAGLPPPLPVSSGAGRWRASGVRAVASAGSAGRPADQRTRRGPYRAQRTPSSSSMASKGSTRTRAASRWTPTSIQRPSAPSTKTSSVLASGSTSQAWRTPSRA